MPSSVRLLALLALLTFLLGLGRSAITDSDEAFYAEASREMVESGDWLTPHFNYQDRWQKPILYYWATAATYLVTGVTEFSARLWSAAAGVGLVLITWLAAARLTTDQRAAWLAGAITATSYGYAAMARSALPDLPLTLFITATIWWGFDRRWLAAGVAAGLGFLTKGPLAIIVPLIVLVPAWWWEGTARSLRARDLLKAASAFVAIALPWYAAMTAVHGRAYLESFFLADNLERFATDRFNDPRPLWFYVPVLIGGMMPWSAYLLTLPIRPSRALLSRTRQLSTSETRLLLWAVLPFLFFTASIGKQPRYILPVLPPIAILLARAISSGLRHAEGGRVPRDLRAATWITAAVFLGLALVVFRLRPLFDWLSPAGLWMTVAVTAGGALALAAMPLTRRWSRLPVVLVCVSAALIITVHVTLLAGARPAPVEQMAALVLSHRTAGEPVGTYQAFVRNLVFYTRVPQADLFDEQRAADFLKLPRRVLLVTPARDLPRLRTLSGTAPTVLAEVRYVNTANIRLRTLLLPDPQADLDTILLVANR